MGREKERLGSIQLIEFQMEAIEDDSFDFRLDDASHYKELIIMHLQNNQAVLTQDNQVEIFTDGREKFDALMEDLKNAKDHIHIQYYIFRLDNLRTRDLQCFIRKSKTRSKSSRSI